MRGELWGVCVAGPCPEHKHGALRHFALTKPVGEVEVMKIESTLHNLLLPGDPSGRGAKVKAKGWWFWLP